MAGGIVDMKIMLFTQFFPPETGAAPQRAFNHAKYWAKSGHTVTVVTNVPNSPLGRIYKGHRNKFSQREVVEGFTVTRLWTLPAGKKTKVIIRFFSSVLYVIMSLRALFLEKPDIIVGTAPYFAGFSAYIIARLRRVPIVYELRDPWLQILGDNSTTPNLYFRILKKIEMRLTRRADRVVVVGGKMSRCMEKHYSLPETPIPIFNGVDKPDVLNLKAETPSEILQKMDGLFRIGFIGNLGIWYDIDPVIEAARLLEGEPVGFFFLGDGKLKKELNRRVEMLGLDNIFLFDVLPHDQALAVVQECDLTILPFKKKVCDLCLPLKFFESMGMGTPVLSCNGDETDIIIGNSGAGAIFDSDNPGHLAGIIRDYVRNPGKVKTQGEQGRKFVVETYNRERMAEKYTALFTEIIAKKENT